MKATHLTKLGMLAGRLVEPTIFLLWIAALVVTHSMSWWWAVVGLGLVGFGLSVTLGENLVRMIRLGANVQKAASDYSGCTCVGCLCNMIEAGGIKEIFLNSKSQSFTLSGEWKAWPMMFSGSQTRVDIPVQARGGLHRPVSSLHGDE